MMAVSLRSSNQRTRSPTASLILRYVFSVALQIFFPADTPQCLQWNKYIQRILCPCCFGRGCLVNNHGYLSEAGAYVVDEFFKLSVVPPTRVVLLSSPSFHYSKVARLKAEAVDKVMVCCGSDSATTLIWPARSPGDGGLPRSWEASSKWTPFEDGISSEVCERL